MTDWGIGFNAAGSALDFPNPASFVASGSVLAGDRGLVQFANATRSLEWLVGATTVNKAVTIEGYFPGRIVSFVHTASVFFLTAGGTIKNLTICSGLAAGAECVDISTASGGGVENCDMRESRVGVQVNSGANCTIKNNMISDSVVGVQVVNGTANVLNNEAVRCATYGIQAAGGTTVAKNNIALWCATGYNGSFDGSSTNNASTDTTSPGSNPINSLDTDAAKFLCLSAPYFYPSDFRIASDSSLVAAGANAGLTTDMDGRTYDAGVYPVGPSKGVYLPTTNNDYILTTATPAGNYVGPDASIVKLGESFGVGDTGTYDPTGTPCDPPTLTLTAGDGQLVASCVAASGCELIPMYLRYWEAPDGAYSAESVGLSRTGDGDITVTSLTNEQVYGVLIYHKDGTKLGYCSQAEYAAPTDGSNAATGIVAGPLGTLKTMLSECSAWQTLTGAGSAAEAATHIYLEAVPASSSDATPAEYTSEISSARPFAVICAGEEWTAARIAVEDFSLSGSARLEFEAEVPAAYQGQDAIDAALIWWHRVTGDILSDLKAKSGVAGNLYLGQLSLKEGPFRADDHTKAQQGDFVIVAYEIMWGIPA